MLDRSRSSSIAPLAPGEEGGAYRELLCQRSFVVATRQGMGFQPRIFEVIRLIQHYGWPVCPDTDGDNRPLRGRGKRGARLRLRRTRVRGLLHDLDYPWADVGVPSGINHRRFKLDRDQERFHT